MKNISKVIKYLKFADDRNKANSVALLASKAFSPRSDDMLAGDVDDNAEAYAAILLKLATDIKSKGAAVTRADIEKIRDDVVKMVTSIPQYYQRPSKTMPKYLAKFDDLMNVDESKIIPKDGEYLPQNKVGNAFLRVAHEGNVIHYYLLMFSNF